MRVYFTLNFFIRIRSGELIMRKYRFNEFLIKVRHSARARRMTEPKTKSSIQDIEIFIRYDILFKSNINEQ